MTLFGMLDKAINFGRPKSAILLADINADGAGTRVKGEKVTIMFQHDDGTFHAEWNDWACKIKQSEFKYI